MSRDAPNLAVPIAAGSQQMHLFVQVR